MGLEHVQAVMFMQAWLEMIIDMQWYESRYIFNVISDDRIDAEERIQYTPIDSRIVFL